MNAIPACGLRPRRMRRRATGTEPHSQTGMAKPAAAAAGTWSGRGSRPRRANACAGTNTAIRAEATAPIRMKGSASTTIETKTTPKVPSTWLSATPAARAAATATTVSQNAPLTTQSGTTGAVVGRALVLTAAPARAMSRLSAVLAGRSGGLAGVRGLMARGEARAEDTPHEEAGGQPFEHQRAEPGGPPRCDIRSRAGGRRAGRHRACHALHAHGSRQYASAGAEAVMPSRGSPARAPARTRSRSGSCPVAGGALAPQRHVVRVDRVVQAACHALDHALEVPVLEGGHLTAAVTDEMVVVVAARIDRLVARDAFGHVHPPGEVEAGQQLERPVDARHSHILAPLAEPVRDLPGGHAAAEIGQRLDHDRARRTQPVAVPLERSLRVLGPVLHRVKDRLPRWPISSARPTSASTGCRATGSILTGTRWMACGCTTWTRAAATRSSVSTASRPGPTSTGSCFRRWWRPGGGRFAPT